MDEQLGAGLAVRPHRAPRPRKPPLDLVEPPEPEQRHAPVAKLVPTTGSSIQPCSAAIRTASSLRSSPTASEDPVQGQAIPR